MGIGGAVEMMLLKPLHSVQGISLNRSEVCMVIVANNNIFLRNAGRTIDFKSSHHYSDNCRIAYVY